MRLTLTRTRLPTVRSDLFLLTLNQLSSRRVGHVAFNRVILHMPGPSNKKKPKSRRRDPKNGSKPCNSVPISQRRGQNTPSPTPSPSQQLFTPPPIQAQISEQLVYLPPPILTYGTKADRRQPADDGILIPPRPFIYDPGTGPRVRDPRAFLSSAYFAEKPAMHVRLAFCPSCRF